MRVSTQELFLEANSLISVIKSIVAYILKFSLIGLAGRAVQPDVVGEGCGAYTWRCITINSFNGLKNSSFLIAFVVG